MSANPEFLDPPNPHPHRVLPAADTSASENANSHHSIIAAHDNGITLIDDTGTMEGFLTIFGGLGFCAAGWMGTMMLWKGGADIASVGMLFGAFLCLLMIRADTIAYRYEPVLFDRAAGKVHVFAAEQLSQWKLWQLKPDSHITTFDWPSIRGEVVEFKVAGGSGTISNNYALVGAAVAEPGSRHVIGRFHIGLSYPWSADPMVERWEYVRRFMQGDGPALGPNELLFNDESTVKLWDAITFGQPLIGPGSAQYWNGKALNGWWFLTIPAGIVFLAFLPFTIAAGLLRWASHAVKREPTWPDEILASIGAPIRRS